MAENETPASETGKHVMLSRIYIKDCSFESPRAPAVFSEPVTPEIKVSMRTANQQIDGDVVEVTLTVTAEASADGHALFLVEVHQAGLFTVRGFNEQERGMILGSYCPGILFPYARSTVSDLVLKGSMPALLLQPVNFDAMYARSVEGAAPESAGDN